MRVGSSAWGDCQFGDERAGAVERFAWERAKCEHPSCFSAGGKNGTLISSVTPRYRIQPGLVGAEAN